MSFGTLQNITSIGEHPIAAKTTQIHGKSFVTVATPLDNYDSGTGNASSGFASVTPDDYAVNMLIRPTNVRATPNLPILWT